MAEKVPHSRMPGLFEQLSVLPPRVQWVAGTLMVGFGVAAVLMVPTTVFSWVLLAVGSLLGIPLTWQGISRSREQRSQACEMERAREELASLREQVADLADRKRGVERFLIERGYTSGKVRRWIALECGVVLPAGVSAPLPGARG